MKLNVARKVKHYRLSKVKAYYSIFEAISNSIDSQSANNSREPIRVTFCKDNSKFELFPDKNDKSYKEIRIEDSGEGFTDKNFESFETSDSDHKENIGGKGLGRFSWLKVFESVKISSVYKSDEIFIKREFDFQRTVAGISNHKTTPSDATKTGTTLHLIGQKKDWEIPKKLQTFCDKLIEHFLPMFIQKSPLSIKLTDGDTGDEICALEYFKANYNGEIASKPIIIKNQKFNLSIHKTKIGSSNQLILVANHRATKSINLAKYIVDLNAELIDESGPYYIIAFLTGEYLDDGVTPERDDFVFGYEEATDEISVGEICKACAQEVEREIQPILIEIKSAKELKINKFVSTEGPEYRYLLARNPHIIDEISPTASAAEIEDKLHRAEIDFKSDTKLELNKLLSEDNLNSETLDDVYEKVSEAAHADLVKYILWRAHVISVLEKRSAWDDEKVFEREQVLHKLFYKMRSTSADIPFESNNLWLIDERLNFHDYLASDLSMEPKAGDRPDILSYNSPHFFNNEDSPSESFSIIEFKRPNRNDYTDDENPIDQVFGYIEKIRANKARRKDGQIITVSQNSPCFVYIICDLTDKIRTVCGRYDTVRRHDNQGYFWYNSGYNAYIEVSSYQRIAIEARNRNRIFMKKLGLK